MTMLLEALLVVRLYNNRTTHTLGDEVIQHLRVHNPVNWVEDEDSASHKCSLDFVDEKVVPWRFIPPAVLFLIRWFGNIYQPN